jgi:hypothetical protein
MRAGMILDAADARRERRRRVAVELGAFVVVVCLAMAAFVAAIAVGQVWGAW